MNSYVFSIPSFTPRRRQGFGSSIPLLFLALLGVSSCKTVEITPPATPTAPEPVVSAPVSEWVNAARHAIRQGHLVSPFQASALQLTRQALQQSPDDNAVLLLRSDVCESLLAATLDLISQERLSAATEMLAYAQTLDPAHPNLPAVARRLANAERYVSENLYIHPPDLRNRSAVLREQLAALGKRIVAAQASIRIRTSNDSAARWTYQQLSQDVDLRISATMEYGAPPAIIIRWPREDY